MSRFVVMRGSKKLSGFFPNGLNDVFAFRSRSWYSFATKEEARDFITRINKEINKPDNVSRYGEVLAKKLKSVAKNLYVAEDG